MRIFEKFHGGGNDFILVEDFDEAFPIALIPELCTRHTGIGADGLILARRSKMADFSMHYYNADGSYASMCGNGLRCFVHFLYERGFQKSRYLIEVGGKCLTVMKEGSKISTILPIPTVLKWGLSLFHHTGYAVDAGVPHLVVFSQKSDFHQEGRLLRMHEEFEPAGINVNFVTDLDPLSIATYERGVETITGACGSGVAACAFVAHKLGKAPSIVKVATPSGAILEVEISNELIVSGPSVKVFEGSFSQGWSGQ